MRRDFLFLTKVALCCRAVRRFVRLRIMGSNRKHTFHRTGMAHLAESGYRRNRPKPADEPIKRDVHDFLDYCRLRAEVARHVEGIFHAYKNPALLGVLTGSVGPLINARELAE